MLGIDYRKAMERHWFALKNFHMVFYEDSGKLNEYLHHWDGGQTLEDFFREVRKRMPMVPEAYRLVCETHPSSTGGLWKMPPGES